MIKYHNKKVIYQGIKFDSTMERDYYIYLLDLKDKGVVTNIELQPLFVLQDKFTYKNKCIRAITYKADFRVTYQDRIEVIDVKGMVTDVFKIKRKMLLAKYDVDFKCVRKVRNQWKEI